MYSKKELETMERELKVIPERKLSLSESLKLVKTAKDLYELLYFHKQYQEMRITGGR